MSDDCLCRDGHHYHETVTYAFPYPVMINSCCRCGSVYNAVRRADTNDDSRILTTNHKECADGLFLQEELRVIERTRRLEEMAYEITTYSVIPDSGRHSPYGGSE